ncbi:MAG TPA: hypothetical protein VNL14_11255 [Candidatus Acidoferrales bacterium]|nr:hypothetical protein [Candidatus Acidoferrales bacterium]
MSSTVCVAPVRTLEYPKGGGHLWEYLNWALGLRALGCKVIWLEVVPRDAPRGEIESNVAALATRLEPYGLGNCLALYPAEPRQASWPQNRECLDLDAAAEADLLLDFRYNTPQHVVSRFRRSALLDIDPGLSQAWVSKGRIKLTPHDLYFTTGETVGQPGSGIPDLGLKWIYTRPCVALDWWPPHRPPPDAPFTTVAHWYAGGWLEDDALAHLDDKRSGFLPFLDLPRLSKHALELALDLAPEDEQRWMLEARGWRVVDAHRVAATPWEYQAYIQGSLAEFSCAKPACLKLQNGWLSNRTLCYLASGKPAVVQHTGPSRFLPESAGLFRFRDIDQAAQYLETVATDYERQSGLARALAEELFDARKVASKLLEQALP